MNSNHLERSDLLTVFEDPDKVIQALADSLASSIRHLLATRGQCFIALSGGQTPRLLFTHLTTSFRDAVEWQMVHFYWVDERCVPPAHPESNYGITNKLLLEPLQISDIHQHRIRGECPPASEVLRYGNEIRETVPFASGLPQFDWALLGMGSDGHFASIFPNQMNLLTSSDLCSTAVHPTSGQLRISLTGRVINNCRELCMLVLGIEKANRVADVLERRPGFERIPAAHIKPAEGHLHWFVDQAAMRDCSGRRGRTRRDS